MGATAHGEQGALKEIPPGINSVGDSERRPGISTAGESPQRAEDVSSGAQSLALPWRNLKIRKDK